MKSIIKIKIFEDISWRVNTDMSRKYTEQQKIEIYNNPVRIEMMPHDKMTKAEQDGLQNTLETNADRSRLSRQCKERVD